MRIVIGVVLLLAIAVGVASPNYLLPQASAQERCSDTYTPPPVGPQAPTDLLLFRAPEDTDEGTGRGIFVTWINHADNALCVAVEGILDPGRSNGGSGPWGPIVTIQEPTAGSYLHEDAPMEGEMCYRVYASNDFGRSAYSNRACLLVTSPDPTLEPTTVPNPQGPSEDAGGLEAWHIALIGLGAAGVVGVGAGGGLMLASWRRRHSPP